MDVALSPWESDKALVVDSMGGVWEWTGGKAMYVSTPWVLKVDVG